MILQDENIYDCGCNMLNMWSYAWVELWLDIVSVWEHEWDWHRWNDEFVLDMKLTFAGLWLYKQHFLLRMRNTLFLLIVQLLRQIAIHHDIFT